ncbi:MAG: MarR family transcriptional regulator [Ruminococcus sp.]|nr:MarR family transcriptional regulator [Ruminococcus sp.]
MRPLPEEYKQRPRELLDRENAEPSMFINDIAKLFGKMISHESEEGLSHGYRRMFGILCFRDGITQIELAKAANLSAPTVSNALNKMETLGLVRREFDKTDKRKAYVYITEKGRAQDEYIRSQCREIEQVMMRGVTEEERAALISILKKMLRNMLEEGDA